MSRIHEALKKAEQERGTVQTADIPASPQAPAITTPTVWEEGEAPHVAPHADLHVAEAPAPRPDRFRSDNIPRRAHPAWNLDPNVNVFSDPNLNAHGAEQFRTLRSRLYQIRNNQTLRVVLVTSSVPGEGKTFVTSNLGQAMVRQTDRRVLMIDADLRRARLHVPLGASFAPGLTDYLRGDVDDMDVIQTGPSENLCFIPGGNEVTDPSELLSNGRMKKLLERVTPMFDWVILDSPPCLPVLDSSVLAEHCDGVLMVVHAGSTPSQTVQKACQEFRERNLIGIVLNRAEKTSSYGGDSYYYGYTRPKVDSPQK